jgi:hypothetical protein
VSDCRRDRLTAAILGLVSVLWLLAVEGKQGIGRDEAQYFRAGERYWGWFESGWQNLRAGHFGRTFSRPGIDAYWGDNPEHPPLMKTLYGISWRMFHRCHCTGPTRNLHPIPVAGKHVTLPLFERESSAFRFPAILMAGFGVALAYIFARRFLGRVSAGAAAVLAIAQPHYFFHAQISCFDAPITTMALLVGYAYFRSLRSRRWGILCGVFYGLAFATKLNAWLMPFFLFAHYAWLFIADRRQGKKPRPAWAFLSMATLGPLVFFAIWPYLWPDPGARLGGYFRRHLEHEHYNFEYLGRNWNLPPKDFDLKLLRMTFPFVSTVFTVPATTLVLAVAGGVVLLRRRRKDEEGDDGVIRESADRELAPGVFLATQIFGPMCVLAIPSAPIFGGVKHFLPAVPYLAICAGIGLRWLTQVASRLVIEPRVQRALPAAVAAVVCLPAVVETQRSHPDGLSHYNFFAGGFAGGASLGMNRQFWGYSVLPMLPWMAEHAPRSGAIYWHDVLGDAILMYERDGRLPVGIGNLGADEGAIPRSDLGIVIHEKHFTVFEGDFWTPYGTTQPVYVRTREGVPLVTAYRRPGAP